MRPFQRACSPVRRGSCCMNLLLTCLVDLVLLRERLVQDKKSRRGPSRARSCDLGRYSLVLGLYFIDEN